MNDLKFAIRQMMKNRGFTAVVALTLGLGIGATTMVFSIVNGVLLEPLDFPGFERIVHVWESDPQQGFAQRDTSPANFADWRRQNTLFEVMAFTAEHDGMTTRSFIHNEQGLALNLRGRFVSSDYFAVYGIKPILGRSFLPEEEAKGAARVVVISHRLWMQLYDGDTRAMGKLIPLENNGRHTYEIVGIMPEGFREPGADVWVPCAHMPFPITQRGRPLVHVVGRLKQGVSLTRAKAEMDAIQGGIHAEYRNLTGNNANRAIGSQIHMTPLLDQMVENTRSSLIMFSGAVALAVRPFLSGIENQCLSTRFANKINCFVGVIKDSSR